MLLYLQEWGERKREVGGGEGRQLFLPEKNNPRGETDFGVFPMPPSPNPRSRGERPRFKQEGRGGGERGQGIK